VNRGTTFYQFHPTFGFWGIPDLVLDVSFDGKCKDVFIRVSHNAEGNRDKAFVQKPHEGILCLGGSHTWGGGVEQENRYSNLLELRTGIPTFNLGHCSFGLDQIGLALLEKADFYKPAIVIIEQYPWSIHRILSHYVAGFIRPYFYIDVEGNLKLQKVPKLASFNFCRKIIGNFHAYWKELNEFKADISLREKYDPLTDPIFLYWKAPYYDYMYKLAEKIVIVMKDFCLQKNMKLLFSLGAIAQQFSGENPCSLVDYDLPIKRLASLLEENNIEHVDVSGRMLREHSTGDPVVFSDGHINAKGNTIVAYVLQKKLHELGWI